MADKLAEFLIAVAKDEKALKKFLKNPKREATEAGVPPDQIAILLSGEAHAIFKKLQQFGPEYPVWIISSPQARRTGKSPKRKPRPARKAR